MSTKPTSGPDERAMSLLGLIVGLIGIALQFAPGWELIAFMLSVAVLGVLLAAGGRQEDPEAPQARQSYRTVLEWFLLFVLAAYAFLELSRFLPIPDTTIEMLNGHWPGFVLAVLCIFLGLAGLRRSRSGDSA